jgi:hypothetical protein
MPHAIKFRRVNISPSLPSTVQRGRGKRMVSLRRDCGYDANVNVAEPTL